jgi:hypothetical protein
MDEKLIEPDAAVASLDPLTKCAYSSAISLKRIADALTDGGVFRQPVNNYGESFTDAIQMALVRGQRGIDVI